LLWKEGLLKSEVGSGTRRRPEGGAIGRQDAKFGKKQEDYEF
jgi:hypothetical protein